MQRGLLFLICAALQPFVLLSRTNETNTSSSIVDDYENINIEDLPNIIDASELTELEPNLHTLGLSPNNGLFFNTNIGGRFGLINHSNICYMSAFITAAFNVQSFREALYECEPKNASTVMLAEVFAKLQTAKRSISTNLCLMPALTKEIGWNFGRFECNMEFSGRILNILPESVQSLYKISVRTNFYLQENGALLKSKVEASSNGMVVPAFESIANAIETRFRNSVDYKIKQSEFAEYEGIIEPFSENEKSFQVNSEEIIENRPEIMIFGIARKLPEGFNTTPMKLDFELTFPGYEPVKYVLQSFCYHLPGHYVSYARDFTGENPEGDWYQYNDSTVKTVNNQTEFETLKNLADTSATLAFYVRADSVVTRRNYREAQIPERIMTIAKLMLALEDIQDRRNETTNEVEEKKTRYRSPPAENNSNLSPKSVDSIASTVATPQSLINSENDDENKKKKRSENVPSPTNDRFLGDFPLDADYFPNFA